MSYTMRVNLSVAIVAMVDQPSSELNQSYVNNTECPGELNYVNTTHEVWHQHRKTQMSHLIHLSHSGSVHGQNDSKICKK